MHAEERAHCVEGPATGAGEATDGQQQAAAATSGRFSPGKPAPFESGWRCRAPCAVHPEQVLTGERCL